MKTSTGRSGASGLDRLELEVLRRAWERSPSVLVVTDPSGNIEYVNPAFEKINGYTAEEVVGKNPRILKSGTQPPGGYADLWKTISSGGTWTGRLQNRRKDGSLYWESATIFPVCGRRGKILRYIAVKENITAEVESLLKMNGEFRAVFEVASVGMAQADPRTGRFLRVNDKLCEITGYSAAELLKMRARDITHAEDRAEAAAQLQRVLRGDLPSYRLEKRYLRKGGRVIWVNVNMSVIRDAAGLPVRTMAAIEDITDRRQMEELLRNETLRRQALEQEVMAIAEGEQRRIGSDLHDGICQELAGIKFVIELIARRLPKDLPEKDLLAKTVEDIRKVILHTRDLSHALGPGVLEKGDISTALAELAANTKSTFGIACSFSCPEPPLIPSSSTATHLYRIAQEAIQNAIRHGGATSIGITLLPSGANWVLRVADNGTPSDQGEKSGSGLHIMDYRASMIGGSLQFQQNGGATVTCTFSL